MQSGNLYAEPLFTLAFGSIGASYALIGTTTQPSQILFFQNSSDITLTFSFDGVNDHFQLPTLTTLTLNAGAAKGTYNTLSVPQGTSVYVKGAGSSSGSANFTSWYMGQPYTA